MNAWLQAGLLVGIGGIFYGAASEAAKNFDSSGLKAELDEAKAVEAEYKQALASLKGEK